MPIALFAFFEISFFYPVAIGAHNIGNKVSLCSSHQTWPTYGVKGRRCCEGGKAIIMRSQVIFYFLTSFIATPAQKNTIIKIQSNGVYRPCNIPPILDKASKPPNAKQIYLTTFIVSFFMLNVYLLEK